MLFSEIYDRVVVNTNRPDLTAETIQHIQTATTHYHILDFWSKDLKERIIPLPSNPDTKSFTFQIDIKKSMINCRKAKYFRKWDTINMAPGVYFSAISPSQVMDSYSFDKPNRFYLAGQTYNFISDTVDLAVLAGWYAFPNVAPITAYESWVADEMPDAIIDRACQTLLALIGKADEASRYEKLVNNPQDPFNPGWIQKLYSANLVVGSETTSSQGSQM